MALSVAWHPDPRTTSSPYVARQADQLRTHGVEVLPFRLHHLLQTNTVVHIHWPEHLARSHRTASRLLKPVFALATIALLRGPARARVVWTVHNLAPHRPAATKIEGKVEQALFRALARRVDAVVTLVAGHEHRIRNRFEIDSAVPVVHIPEGVEHPVEPRRAAPDTSGPVEFLAVGSLIPYKGYVEAATAMAKVPQGQAHLRIVGHPTDPSVAKALGDCDYASVSVEARRVSDQELEHHSGAAHAVLVASREPFNSGTPYWALSRNLPVVMVQSPLAEELAEAFGDEWVHQLPADFTHHDLERAIAWVRTERPTVTTSRWSWDAVTTALAGLYRST